MDTQADTSANRRTFDIARALGIDLAAALRDRRITRQAHADMVDACAHCTWAEACSVWVRTGEVTDRAPEICANRAALSRLRS